MAFKTDPKLIELEAMLDELKREYDLFLAGQRRQEPLRLREQVERSVRRLTRSPTTSTVHKFQLKTLAHRFRALETQLKNILDLRAKRRAASEKSATAPTVLYIDALAIENPDLVHSRIKTMIEEAQQRMDESGRSLKIHHAEFAEKLMGKAKSVLGKNNVKAVRFQIISGEKGPKVMGDLITAPDSEPEPAVEGPKK